MQIQIVGYIYTIFTLVQLANSVELTFELPDNARECFYEEIQKNTSATLEFQVNMLYYNLGTPITKFSPWRFYFLLVYFVWGVDIIFVTCQL